MSERIDLDVLVVGAGPAGTAAATTLARHGLEVLVVDRARFPRDKCCGDGLTTGALRRLDALGLDPGSVASFTPVDELAVRSPSGRTAYLPLGRSGGIAAAVARRVDLDAALAGVAQRAGARMIEGDGLAALAVGVRGEVAGRACAARLASGTEVRSRFVVGADGAWSRVRAELGSGDRHGGRVLAGGWHAFRAYARGTSPAARERLWVRFDPRLLPGYAWSFPLRDGSANVGICTLRGRGIAGAELAAAWRDELAHPFLTSLVGPGAELESTGRSWPIPAGVTWDSLVARGGRVLFAGDAARAADPFTGEGIAQALETGVACAEAIARAPHAPERAGEEYASGVLGTLGVEHRLSRCVSALLASPGGARAAVRLAGANPWTRRNAARWLYEDVPRTLPVTPSKWTRESLATSVPFRGELGA